MRVLGLDISGRDKFAYTVVEAGSALEQGTASATDLLKVIKKYKPEVLAVDSISELMEHGKIVVKALGRLPFNVEVVEVTRTEDNTSIPMEVLAEKYFKVSRSHLDPLETSLFAALLAERGLGARIKLYEEETVILIKRVSSTSPGGMSRNRYMRNVKHRIRDLADRISRRLNEVGLDYDLFFKEESGDITSAKFVVYARRDLVRRYVKPLKSSDVVIRVFSEPVKSYESERGDQYLIVGVDPGIVTGIAIMDLEGKVLHTEARRNLSRGESLRRIYQWGVPVIIATDVSDVPDYVKKLAAMSGAVLYKPEKDLSVSEKSSIAEKIGYPVETSHERDALAAAYKAFAEYRTKFERLERDFGAILTRRQLAEAKALVARGKSIAQAVAEVLKGNKDMGYTKVVYIPIEKPCKNIDEYNKMMINALEYEKNQLEKEIEELRSRVSSLSRALNDSLWRDAKYRELQRRVEDLSASLKACMEEKEKFAEELMEIVLGLVSGRYKLYREDEISECRKAGGILCSDISTVEEAVNNGVLGVPVGLVTRYRSKGYYIIDEFKRRELAERIRNALTERRIDLKKLLDEYRRRLPG
ncbi:hypothetical protein TUZN_1846 [Thermoproteus uzoniensis 768-20]|uniref:Nuclease RuvC n=1 Tax=Thermoproteus uzoniensis (strain 768-20) TaxID=999630 RepID=F2L3Z4_THEU7|nr:DUF460 domain-containing protein [Thermoproteus uzoniensis]AEA13306.1 hypothetical protein TUZN_1846 [Thermoproteus uzoniensis 768-20]